MEAAKKSQQSHGTAESPPQDSAPAVSPA